MTLARVAIGGVVCLGLLVRGLPGAEPSRPRAEAFSEDRQKREIAADWIARDGIAAGDGWPEKLIRRVLDESGPAAEELCRQFDELAKAGAPPGDPRWTTLYFAACERRRAARLAPHADLLRRIVFTKHYDLGGSHYAYTEGQSDAQRERHFEPGSSLALFEMDGLYGTVRTLLDDPGGVIRDPDVSPDGRRVLFAWKKSLDEDDYHLYEMTLDDRARPADHLGPGLRRLRGRLSARRQTSCSTRPAACRRSTAGGRRSATCSPATGDGRYPAAGRLRPGSHELPRASRPTAACIYTRWDYNDRGQIFPQGLFQMNPDGTGQTEVYGNNSWFPTTILHARAIPGTSKIVCDLRGPPHAPEGLAGHHRPATRTAGEPGRPADRARSATRRPCRSISYGQSGDQFQYPYPLDENDVPRRLSTRGAGGAIAGARTISAIYVITSDGRRELLVSDPAISCNQPIPLASAGRRRAGRRPRRLPAGHGHGLPSRRLPGAGAGRRAARRGQAVARRGPGVSRRGRRREPQQRAGRRGPDQHADLDRGRLGRQTRARQRDRPRRRLGLLHGPRRTPLYFQALDEKGQMIQSMRSWATLQPGEAVSCVGCHENKNTSPPVGRASLAMLAGPRALATPYDPARGFSFIREVQPMLDRHCVRCHYLDEPPRYGEPSTAPIEPTTGDETIRPAFSLKGTQTLDPTSRRKWSDAYRALADRRVCDWINVQSAPPMLPPYHAGASQSRLMRLLGGRPPRRPAFGVGVGPLPRLDRSAGALLRRLHRGDGRRGRGRVQSFSGQTPSLAR